MSARKNVANQRNNATIMPAPETLQEFPRQEAAEDAAQRYNQRCTHHDSKDQNINPSRPAEPTRGRLHRRKKDNKTRHRRGAKTSHWHEAVSDIKVEPPELLAIDDFVDHRAVSITVTLRRE